MGNADSYDVVVVGTGPAGLQAGIHASRKKVSVLIVGKSEKAAFSGHTSRTWCACSMPPASRCWKPAGGRLKTSAANSWMKIF